LGSAAHCHKKIEEKEERKKIWGSAKKGKEKKSREGDSAGGGD
jgi:hypothetical protein